MKTGFIVFYFSLLFFIAVYGIHLYWMIIVYRKNRNRKLEPESGDIGVTEFPKVTVQLPIFNENRVAVRLISAVINLDWPKDCLEIQILDDSTDDTIDIIGDIECQTPQDTVIRCGMVNFGNIGISSIHICAIDIII